MDDIKNLENNGNNDDNINSSSSELVPNTTVEVEERSRRVTRKSIRCIVKQVRTIELSRNKITGMETADEFYGKNVMLDLIKKSAKTKDDEEIESDEESKPKKLDSNKERLKELTKESKETEKQSESPIVTGPSSELRGMKMAFQHFDHDGNGSVTAIELQAILKNLAMEASLDECQELVEKFDFDENGSIDLAEFTYLLMSFLHTPETEDDVMLAFKTFDKAETGFIEATELRRIMTNLGDKLNDSEVDDMLRVSDLEGDGHINYEEFTKKMIATCNHMQSRY